MTSRRRFLACASGLAATMLLSRVEGQQQKQYQFALPLVLGSTPTSIPTVTPWPEPTQVPQLPPLEPTQVPTMPTMPILPLLGDDMPILGPASGTFEEAQAWLSSHTNGYTPYAIGSIVDAYRMVGEQVGMDWFMSIAQMAHETGSLTSFWSQRPQRNPAGIGVDGSAVAGLPTDAPPAPRGWAYNTQRNRWEKGLSFPSWANDSVPAHMGRLLAYALRDEWANDAQRQLIAQALAWRPLPADRRGVALSYVGLNGRWAVPGTTYGQTIIGLARKMRGLA